jgi:hypothetical protein
MSYTITISGSAQPDGGQTQDQADAAVVQKARQLAGSLPGVSAAFIQTISGGLQSLTEQPQTPAAPTEGTPSG